LASEIIQGKYTLPSPLFPESLLAKHEQGVITEARQILSTLGKHHRGEQFNELLLPRCRSIVEAIGHRMAYEAAEKAGVRPALLELYKCHVIGLDIGWYIENGLISRSQLQSQEVAATTQAMAELDRLLKELDCEEYAIAPIVSNRAWRDFTAELPVFRPIAAATIIQENSRL
jgi:acyl-CoA oxidase